MRDVVHFAIFGLAITVLVAWSFALWAEKPVLRDAGTQTPSWPAHPRAGWPESPRVAMRGGGTGYDLAVAQTTRRVPDADEPRGFYFGTECRLEHHCAGWPARALTWDYWIEPDARGARGVVPLPAVLHGLGRARERGLPYRVRPGGLALNTAFYGTIGWILFGLPPALIRARRAWQGRCARCGHLLSSAGCTECGAGFDARGRPERRYASTS